MTGTAETTETTETTGLLGLDEELWTWIRRVLITAYVVGTILVLRARGTVPIDREIIVAWIAVLALVATIGRRRRDVLITLASWAPFLLALFLYDFARAIGHWLHRPVAVTPQITIDRFLGGGQLWTERLQQKFIDRRIGLGRLPLAEVERRLRTDQSAVHWYDVVVSAAYNSHFLVPYLAAGVLWRKGQRLWRWYAATFVGVTFTSCAIFALYATAPPWYAAQQKLIAPFPRALAGRGWGRIGLHFASRLIEKGQNTVNPFAAIPSLHSAEALLVIVFFWHLTWKWVRPLLVLYPLTMTFTLVYTGEHYLIDVLVGWGMVAIALTTGWWLRRRFGWKSPWRDGPRLDDPTEPLGGRTTTPHDVFAPAGVGSGASA